MRTKIFQFLYWPFALSVLLFTAIMAAMIVNYFPPGKEVLFLTTKRTALLHQNTYLLAFYIHIVTSIFSIGLGVFQFASFLYKRNSTLHKRIGYVYVLSILLLAAPSGFYIAMYANGGLISQVGFYCLSIFWWLSTFRALQFAKQKKFKQHLLWMMRSYAITLAAMSLRTEGYVVHLLFKSNPLETYTLLSWLSWIVNLFIVEILVYLGMEKHLMKQFFNKSEK